MEVEGAVGDMRGEVLELEAFLAREPHAAQVFGCCVEHLTRSGESLAGEKRDEAIVDGARGGACELLKDDRAAKRGKALAPQRDLDRPNRVDYLRQYRIDTSQMRHRLARVGNRFVRHRARIIADSTAGASSRIARRIGYGWASA
jgi:hypothetical protein